MIGTIMTVYRSRGYAFIQNDADGQEYFAHLTDFENSIMLPQYSRVEFELAVFNNRPKAVKIRPHASESVSSTDNFEVRA